MQLMIEITKKEIEQMKVRQSSGCFGFRAVLHQFFFTVETVCT